jgi:hypothetical protein
MGGGEIDQANNISHGKYKLSREKYRENRSVEESQRCSVDGFCG